MIISHKYRFIYFANPKTATTSIEKALKDVDESHTFSDRLDRLIAQNRFLQNRNLIHIAPVYVRQLVGEDIWNGYYKVAFVRNPWDWVISQYCQNFCKVGSKKYKLGLLLNKLSLQPHPDLDCREKPFFTKRDFVLHWNLMYRLRNVEDASNSFQYHFVQDKNGNRVADYIGKFENLKADFETFCNHVGLEGFSLPLSNKSKGKTLSYQQYYTGQTKEIVSKKYERDINLFDYKF